MTAVAAPAEPDDESVASILCACGRIAADVLIDDDGTVTAVVRCDCGAGVRNAFDGDGAEETA